MPAAGTLPSTTPAAGMLPAPASPGRAPFILPLLSCCMVSVLLSKQGKQEKDTGGFKFKFKFKFTGGASRDTKGSVQYCTQKHRGVGDGKTPRSASDQSQGLSVGYCHRGSHRHGRQLVMPRQFQMQERSAVTRRLPAAASRGSPRRGCTALEQLSCSGRAGRKRRH